MPPRRRVVITGIGAIAPKGIGVKAFWNTVRNGINCVGPITFFDASEHPSKVAAEIKEFEPLNYLEPKFVKRMDRCSHMAIAAGQEALKDSGLSFANSDTDHTGVLIGSGGGGLGYFERETRNYWEAGLRRMSSYTITGTFCGGVSGDVSAFFKLHGPSATVSNGCTSSTDALGWATSLIRGGMVDVMLSGGSDACVTPGIVGTFCRNGALSTKWNDTPEKASRPFNMDRDGFVMGEGSWMFILEELDHALKRGAHIYAEIAGYGATCDAYHITQPHPSGEQMARAITTALRDAELAPDAVDYVSPHGTGTQMNDTTETLALKKALGESQARRIPISSVKSIIAHAVGAAGAAGVATCLMSIQDQFVPPTINYENPDPACDLDYVPNVGRPARVDVAISNAIGFGSKNSSLVLKKFE